MGQRPHGRLRVAMSTTPINPSDLIPITGAYAHRIRLPAVAGYEGVGEVIDAPHAHARLVGQRVLPLRGPGTWQRFLDCDPVYAIPVPDDIDNLTAARGYINPLAALRMLQRWPPHGKRVLLTGAGSTCANLLGGWAKRQGALGVTGIHRSARRADDLRRLGIQPLQIDDRPAIESAAARADLTFDALGGALGTAVLESMPSGSTFIGYGLLSGRPLAPSRPSHARYRRFHLRDELSAMEPRDWQQQFDAIWPRLRFSALPEPRLYPLADWRAAVADFAEPGRRKPVLVFDAR